MASFEHDDELTNRFDFRMLQNALITLYRHVEFHEQDLEHLAGLGYTLVRFDAAVWNTDKSIHDDFSAKLDLGTDCGSNLHAIGDRISDIDFANTTGMVLSIANFDSFAKHDSSNASGILAMLAEQSRYRMLFGERLIVIAQVNNPDYTTGPIAPIKGQWNYREWQYVDRS